MSKSKEKSRNNIWGQTFNGTADLSAAQVRVVSVNKFS